MLALVQLPHLRDRRPGQLSGGQQQRVALARALATRPAVLMLDEPLGALDLKLRRQLQDELKRIHRETRTTFLFVTHDQEEALHLSDRIAIMREGRIEQLDEQGALYLRPVNDFVADFIGDVRFLEGTYDPAASVMRLPGGEVIAVRIDAPAGPVKLAVRPEQVCLGEHPEALCAQLTNVVLETGSTLLHLRLPGGQPLLARVLGIGDRAWARGATVPVRIAAGAVAFGGPS
jgi:ABC-type Fe3+/spermidine/putrescine transport system ATPase subunit